MCPTSNTSLLEILTCTVCGEPYDPQSVQTICQKPDCAGPLAARYALEPRPRPSAAELSKLPVNAWRFKQLMPLTPKTNIITLGEGGTPLLQANRLAAKAGLASIWIKDESGNPTGSFKARGMTTAVTRALELGAETIALPTAGNAGGAAAAYAARAGLGCVVVMPQDTPTMFKREVRAFGATLIEHDGLIDDCGKIVARQKEEKQWFDVSTLKEPYRVEGKKTMGFEMAEQLGWKLPDVVIYPTGGGTGLVGMWKAWAEMEALGWIGPERPRMIAVQPQGCAPVVRAIEQNADRCEKVDNATTHASGLRVPCPFADRWILSVIRKSNGTAVAVTEDEIRAGVSDLATLEGIFAAPEGGAVWAGARRLLEAGLMQPSETIVLINTGSGYKYV
ncbi:MAG: threonine synthase [Myxococcota bacterium]|nr:threonine synthase [Myxococcota bacterium]